MKKNLLLYILLAFLILVNGFFLFHFFKGPPHGKPGRGGDLAHFLAKELQFNESQMQQLRALNKGHHQEIQLLLGEIRTLKDALFNNLSEKEYSKSAIDSITSLIGEREKEKDLRTFYHFKAIQDMCDASQKEKFQHIVKDALHRHGKRPPPRR